MTAATITVLAKLQPLTGRAPREPVAIDIFQGKIATIRPTKGQKRGSNVIDLRDTWVTPGLVDSHTHFFYWALERALAINVTATNSSQEAVALLKSRSRTRQVDDWVVGVGFDQNIWGGSFPTAADLDAAFPDTPVIVGSRDGHCVWVNSACLKHAGITHDTPDPAGGRFERDEHGRLTGIAFETAMSLFPQPLQAFAARTDAKAQRIIDRALEDAYRVSHQLGLVGFHSMDDKPSFTHLQRQYAAGTLQLNVVHAVQIAQLDDALRVGLRTGLGDDRFRVGGTKIFSDGALGSQTAYMFDDYPNRPGYKGVAVYTLDELNEMAHRAVEHGWALWVHAIGDQAVDEVTRVIAKNAKHGPKHLVHRIEHAQCTRPATIKRMAQHNIAAAIQPCHIPGDIQTAQQHWPKAQKWAYPFRSLLDAGVVLALGSDVPVERIDPRLSLWAAVTREEETGGPEGGWQPSEKLTLREAMLGFTRGSAAAAGLPEPYGQIAIGAPADLTVWGCDPLKLKPDGLREAPIQGVVIGGNAYLD